MVDYEYGQSLPFCSLESKMSKKLTSLLLPADAVAVAAVW